MKEQEKQKKSLMEAERKYQDYGNNAQAPSGDAGRVPDEQHRMKDQENLRK
ncbi:hypothetical protein JOC77_000536 [Peribacillus deserti]|uniref:YpzI family protein n=1 Tax=Peribacillus deserti TaxID=673318 RepID=A0ABS2QD82_9BACI|nr:hypothetical protein [Peribacillus deserti]MBM7691131.1 hypothetical protein [Peribacillus deserti]